MRAEPGLDQDLPDLLAAMDHAARAIPPAWPLASSVAVNPFLGQTHEDLAMAAARLARVAGAPVTMPRGWYLDRMAEGGMTDDDLSSALAAAPVTTRPTSLADLHSAMRGPASAAIALPTVAELAADISGIDWPGLIAERFGAWAGAYLDEGQALWAGPRGRGAYAAWRAVAMHDLTPEILGLTGFATHVSQAPESADETVVDAVRRIGLPGAAAQSYFHRLLITLGGWAQYSRYLSWHAELGGGADSTLTDFLAIRLSWEAALLERYSARIDERWREIVAAHAAPVSPTADHAVDSILQEAVERAAQRRLADTLSASPQERPATAAMDGRPALQAAFCIDVRSEVFRRALESVSPAIETRGFAGFFGLTAAHRRFASDVLEHRLPVLLNPGLTTRSGDADDAVADRAARLKARAGRAWGRFKLAAVSSFAFVEATGPLYVGKLVGDALGLRTGPVRHDPAPRPDPELDLVTRTEMARTVLRAMSFTTGFARLVVLAGHGAAVVNNPFASGLQCGACGGYSGEVNARLLASVLNDPGVRRGLGSDGIAIPEDTLFVAALHDTTTDAVKLYAADGGLATHAADLAQATRWLAAAGAVARAERAQRLPHAAGTNLARRARDWAELRPEWGLAGCAAFIAAPRRRTRGRNLGGRVFLHDYDWVADEGFGILELILTAPVIVASWISLQYYGSTVAPDLFGGGNKLLHNIVGGIGVVEGNGGVMRAGLPWQSIHDGERFVHDPLRLSVCIEAPREAITEVLACHPDLRALFDNRWLHLFALDDAGRMSWRYAGDLVWTPMTEDCDEAATLMLGMSLAE